MSVARTVVLFGGPDIAADERRLRLSPPKRSQAALALAYLLLAAGPVPADELADAVWPKGPPASWPSGLRRIMSDVRIWLRGGGVDADVRSAHGTYEVVLPTDVTTDVVETMAALAAARATRAVTRPDEVAEHASRAVALLERPLLPAYDAPWLQVHRRDVEHERLEALDLVADAERLRDNPDAAVAAAEQAIALDPLRESSYRYLMAAHRQAGRIGAALRVYEACRRTLTEEVGSAPSPATSTAYHALLDLQIERVPAAVAIGDVTEPADAVAAAAEAMRRLESRQTIATLEARLATIDAAPSPDPVHRVDTLIELGRARWLVEGSTEALRRISIAAGEAALSLGLAGQFADALTLASTTTGIGQSDPDAADLCERGRQAFAEHRGVQVVITGLEAELVFGLESIDLAQQAVDGARALGDERLLLDMLLVLDQSLAWTADLERRLAVEGECNTLLQRVPRSFRRRPTFEVMTRLQLADVAWLDDMDARYPQASRQTSTWELRVYLEALRAVEAKMVGDLPRAQQLATTLMQESGSELNTMHAAGGLLLAIARESGDVGAMVPAIEAMVASNPRISAFNAALILGRTVMGDEPGARALLETQAAHGLDAVAHDHVYPLYLGLLSEAVALLDHAECASALLELLAPYAGLLCVGAHGLVVLNAMDTYRGMLATVVGDPAGPAWFDAGMATEARVRAVLLNARSSAWKAAWLRRHGAPADQAEADRLLDGARAVATAEPDRRGLLAMVDHLATAGR